jgi:hypothetical protein
VWEKPPEAEDRTEFVDYREILRTFNPGDVALIRSVLDAEGITYFIKGERFNTIRPLADPAGVMVEVGQADRALEALKALDLSFKAISGRRSGESDDEED